MSRCGVLGPWQTVVSNEFAVGTICQPERATTAREQGLPLRPDLRPRHHLHPGLDNGEFVPAALNQMTAQNRTDRNRASDARRTRQDAAACRFGKKNGLSTPAIKQAFFEAPNRPILTKRTRLDDTASLSADFSPPSFPAWQRLRPQGPKKSAAGTFGLAVFVVPIGVVTGVLIWSRRRNAHLPLCPDCGRRVSPLAEICPGWGRPLPRQVSGLLNVLANR